MGLDFRRWKRTQQKWLMHMCAQRKNWKQPFGVSAANRVSAVLLSGSRSLYILNKSIFRSAGCLAASPPSFPLLSPFAVKKNRLFPLAFSLFLSRIFLFLKLKVLHLWLSPSKFPSLSNPLPLHLAVFPVASLHHSKQKSSLLSDPWRKGFF